VIARKLDPVNAYVSAVILVGTLCTLGLVLTGAHDIPRALTPEIGVFIACALVGELVPLKIYTRGAEGEITTSACFAIALSLVGGPLVALVGLTAGNLVVDLPRHKPVK